MALVDRKVVFRVAAGIIGLGVMTSIMPAPASAGFFERLFGGLQRAIEAPRPPPRELAYVNPFTSLANHMNSQPRERLRGAVATGPSKAFCVRGCDGRYFPVQAHAGMSAAATCQAFCPASQTQLFAGSDIDYARASDGSRYADSPNAYVYRKQMVPGCTCNGRDAFGLAHVDAASDPTLRAGDIVATKSGLMAFTGSKNQVAGFTPVENYSRLSKSTRDKLSETKIMQPAPSPPDITSAIRPVAANSDDADRARIQFAR